MGRAFWVATCAFGWGVGSSVDQAVAEMCRAFRELEEVDELDVWTFNVRGYDRVGPGWIESGEVLESRRFLAVPVEQLNRVAELHGKLDVAVDDALAAAEGEEVTKGAGF